MTTTGADRAIPKASTLRAWRRVGVLVIVLGIIILMYAGASHLYNWANHYTAAIGYNADGSARFLHPFIDWWTAIPPIIGGIAVYRWSSRKYHYWHRWVRTGEIVNKDIVHYSEYSVAYTIYLKGLNRAGNITTYAASLTHGVYEQTRIGDQFTLGG